MPRTLRKWSELNWCNGDGSSATIWQEVRGREALFFGAGSIRFLKILCSNVLFRILTICT